MTIRERHKSVADIRSRPSSACKRTWLRIGRGLRLLIVMSMFEKVFGYTDQLKLDHQFQFVDGGNVFLNAKNAHSIAKKNSDPKERADVQNVVKKVLEMIFEVAQSGKFATRIVDGKLDGDQERYEYAMEILREMGYKCKKIEMADCQQQEGNFWEISW